MKDYIITRYSFDELSEEAKEQAITTRQEQASREDISWLLEECLTDSLYQILGTNSSADIDLKLYFSLSYSQGDGVALEGRITRAAAPNLSWPTGAAYGYIKHSGHYYHEQSFTLSLCDDEGEEIEDSPIMLEELRGICRKLAREGYGIMESDQSRAVAIEYLDNNTGDDFTLEGHFKPVNEPQLARA